MRISFCIIGRATIVRVFGGREYSEKKKRFFFIEVDFRFIYFVMFFAMGDFFFGDIFCRGLLDWSLGVLLGWRRNVYVL